MHPNVFDPTERSSSDPILRARTKTVACLVVAVLQCLLAHPGKLCRYEASSQFGNQFCARSQSQSTNIADTDQGVPCLFSVNRETWSNVILDLSYLECARACDLEQSI